jgi:hypothetical protein
VSVSGYYSVTVYVCSVVLHVTRPVHVAHSSMALHSAAVPLPAYDSNSQSYASILSLLLLSLLLLLLLLLLLPLLLLLLLLSCYCC